MIYAVGCYSTCSTLFYMEIGVVKPKVETPVAPVEQKKTKGK